VHQVSNGIRTLSLNLPVLLWLLGLVHAVMLTHINALWLISRVVRFCQAINQEDLLIMNEGYPSAHKASSKTAAVACKRAQVNPKSKRTNRVKAKQGRQAPITCVLKAGTVLLLSAFGNSAIAQTLIYDGTSAAGTAQPEAAANINITGLPAWLGISETDQGIVYRRNGDTVTSGADLVIDYTSGITPRFAVGGYSDTGQLVENNTLTIKQGSINGSVAGGLSHLIGAQPELDNSVMTGEDVSAKAPAELHSQQIGANNNTVNLGDDVSVAGNVYGGYATVWINPANTIAANIPAATNSANGLSAFADGSIEVNDVAAMANSNKVITGNNSVVDGSLYGGIAEFHLYTGNTQAGNITGQANPEVSNIRTEANASVQMKTLVLNANSNEVVTGGHVSIGGNIYGGNAIFEGLSGSATAGHISGITLKNDSGDPLSIPMASTELTVTEFSLNSNNNSVTVKNDTSAKGSIYGGNTAFQFQTGHAYGADITSTSFSGEIQRSPESNSATTRAGIESLQLNANGNSVVLQTGASAGQDIDGGNVTFRLRTGDAHGGHITDTKLSDPSTATFRRVSHRADTELRFYYGLQFNANANGNSVTLANGASAGGNMHGGNVTVQVRSGNAYGSDIQNVTLEDLELSAGSFTKIVGVIREEGFQVSAQGNAVKTGDNTTVGKSIYGGNAVLMLQSGNAQTGHATNVTTTQSNSPTRASFHNNADSRFSISFPSINANSNVVAAGNNLSAGENIHGGNTLVQLTTGHAQSADANTLSIRGGFSGGAWTDIRAENLSITANDNAVNSGHNASIGGSIYGGNAIFQLQTGDALTGSITDATLDTASQDAVTVIEMKNTSITANSNVVALKNNASVKGGIYGGNALVQMQTGNAQTGSMADMTGERLLHSTSSSALYSGEVRANSNVVSLGNSASIGESVYGGNAVMEVRSGDAKGGSITDTTLLNTRTYDLTLESYNGSAVTGSAAVSANSNTVSLGNQASVGASIHGGYAAARVYAGDVQGDDIQQVTAQKIQPTLGMPYLGIIDAGATVYGGRPVSANSNAVTVGSNASVGADIYGGYAELELQAGNAQGGDLTDYTIPQIGEHDQYLIFASVGNAASYQSLTQISANDNTVTVGSNTSVGGSVHGGYAAYIAKAGTATGGKHENSSFEDAVVRAVNNSTGVTVSANDNVVTFDGVLKDGSIYGGYTRFDITQGTATLADGSAGDNKVILTDTVAQAINNTVNIGDNARITGTTGSLYGGYLEHNPLWTPQSYDVFSGNTLNFSANPVSVQTLANFEHYNFTVDSAQVNSSTPLITAQNIVLGTDASNSNGPEQASKINVVAISSGQALNAGDAFILMQAADNMTGYGSNEAFNSISQAQQGISLLYDVQTQIDVANQQVTATILGCQTAVGGICISTPYDLDVNDGDNANDSGGSNSNSPRPYANAAYVNPQLKALSEGRLSAAMLITRGADAIAYNALQAIRHQRADEALTPFIITSGGHTRYDSGSHIKSNDILLSTGLVYQNDKLAVGPFIEAGWGSYDSYNSFYSAASVHGDGHNRYYGAGLLGRYELTDNIYTDASVRFGQAHNKFDTTDIQNLASGEYARYTLKSNYVSAHIGAGYLLPLDQQNLLDLSAKYLWTRLAGKDAIIAGDHIQFERINSQRLRLGADLTHRYSDALALNAGLGYEYEFDAKARATTYEIYDIDAADTKGSTGLVTVGATLRPAFNQNLSFDLKAQGYVGKRQGGSLNLQMNYLF